MTVCRDINELTEEAKTACKLFLKSCADEGLDVFVTETYRSDERQRGLWEQGRTKPGRIVTWTLHSRHTDRRAWDIACRGPILYDERILDKAGKIADEAGIIWGGKWKTPDKTHFEVPITWKGALDNKLKRYNTAEEVPVWARDTVNRLIDKGGFADNNRLDLSEDMVRVFVILDRVLKF